MENHKRFKRGEVISSKTVRYVVERSIETSRFGCVFEVLNEADQSFAMKIEWKDEKRRPNPKLGMEIAVLRHIRQSTVSTHYVDFIDQCTKPGFYFMVTTLVDANLEQIMRQMKQRLSHRTALTVGIQVLDALSTLHSLGYIHRDLRPSNLCPGLGKRSGNIYLVNLGRASIYRKETKIRKPREKAPIRGTIPFVSAQTHAYVEQSPKDDMESLLYTIVALCNGLPWKEKPSEAIAKEKKKLREDSVNFFRKLSPSTMKSLIAYLDKLDYYSPVDYEFFRHKFTEAAQAEKMDGFPGELDWEMPSRSRSESGSGSLSSGESPPMSDVNSQEF